jgi:hypothetical protein
LVYKNFKLSPKSTLNFWTFGHSEYWCCTVATAIA